MKNFVLYCAILLLAISAQSQSILVNIPSPPGNKDNQSGYHDSPIFLGSDLYLRYSSDDEGDYLVKFDGTNNLTPIIGQFEYRGSPILFNDKLYLKYKNNQDGFVLFSYDGTTLSEIPSPTGFEYHGYYGYPIVYEDNLYLQYRTNNGNYVLFKYDGITLSKIPNPSGFDGSIRGYRGSPIVFEDNLYLQFRANDDNYTLFKYDGDTLTQIPNPSGFDDSYKGYEGSPIVFGTNLYLRYRENDFSYSLFKYDGDTLTQIPNPSGFDGGYRGYDGFPVVFETNLYIKYTSNNGYYSLLKYDGDTLTEIPNPSGYEVADRGYYGNPIVVGNNLYMKYFDNNNKFNLLKFDGNTFTEIPSPSGFDGAFQGYEGSPIALGDDLYLRYQENNYSYALIHYNGDTLRPIPSPTGYEYYGTPIVNGDDLYLRYRFNNEDYQLFRYIRASRDTSITACSSYQWIDGNTYTESNYHAAHVLSDSNGMDSTIVINLTIVNNDTVIQDSITTYNTTYTYNDSTYNQSGKHLLETHNNVNGCDSLIYLDLQLIESPLINFPSVFCQNDSIELYPQAEDILSGNGLIGNTYYGSTLGVDSLTTKRFTQADSYSLIDSNALFSYIDISGSENFVSLEDEGITNFLPIGFTFKYWGEEVSQFNIISNGWISFDGDTDVEYDVDLPVEDEAYDNSIFLIDTDLNPEVGGEISYATIGTAPNRILVVDFDSVSYYEDYDIRFSAQLQIYEGSNKIEIHTESADNLSNDNNASQGIQSPNDTTAIIVPGRDDSKWVATNDYKAFVLDTILNLTHTHIFEVVGADSSTDTHTACDSFTWIDGNTYTASNTTATHTLTNAAGCDSVVTLDLTILFSNSGTDTQTACDSFTWIDGNTYTTSNTTATHTLTNAAGCDSVVTLDLTILESTSSNLNFSEQDSLVWNGLVFTQSTDTSITIVNSAGCDSVINISLVVLPSVIVHNQSFTICNGESIEVGNSVYAHAGTYIDTLMGANNVDSIVTTTIVINGSIPTPSISHTFVLTLETEQGYSSYQWKLNGNDINGANNYQLNITQGGSYNVVVENSKGCEGVSDPYNVATNSIEQASAGITLYPNPTKNTVIIKSEKMGTYKVLNAYGKLILQGEKTSLNQKIDLSPFAKGIYLVRFNQKTFQLIKQ